MLLFLDPLSGFKYYDLLNAYKFVALIHCTSKPELMKGCGNGSVSLFKAMLQCILVFKDRKIPLETCNAM